MAFRVRVCVYVYIYIYIYTFWFLRNMEGCTYLLSTFLGPQNETLQCVTLGQDNSASNVLKSCYTARV